MDQTLNVTVLLGVVIALGMLVDDAVVVVEAIYYRVERGFGDRCSFGRIEGDRSPSDLPFDHGEPSYR